MGREGEVAGPVLVSAWGLSGERWRNSDNSPSKSKMNTVRVTW